MCYVYYHVFIVGKPGIQQNMMRKIISASLVTDTNPACDEVYAVQWKS